MVLPALVLHKPSPKSKSKDHSLCLEGRLTRWAEDDVESLLHEDRQFRAEYHRMSEKGRRTAILLDLLKGLSVEAI